MRASWAQEESIQRYTDGAPKAKKNRPSLPILLVKSERFVASVEQNGPTGSVTIPTKTGRPPASGQAASAATLTFPPTLSGVALAGPEK
jgi:hypothetical protein